MIDIFFSGFDFRSNCYRLVTFPVAKMPWPTLIVEGEACRAFNLCFAGPQAGQHGEGVVGQSSWQPGRLEVERGAELERGVKRGQEEPPRPYPQGPPLPTGPTS